MGTLVMMSNMEGFSNKKSIVMSWGNYIIEMRVENGFF